jgi:two-component system KDP operon response regulator KdpE
VAGARHRTHTGWSWALLYHLVRNAGHLLPHQALLDRVWGGDYEASPEYLKLFVSRLRAKLRRGDGPEYIETERGRGYRFVRPRELAAAHSGAPPVADPTLERGDRG